MIQSIVLQAIPKQNLSVVLENTLFELDLIETNGCMSVNISRGGAPVVSGQRIVAGQLLIPYESLEDDTGNFMFLTENNALPYYDQFTSTQTLLYASAADLAAVRETPVPLVVNGIVAAVAGHAVGIAVVRGVGHHTP